MMRSGHNQRLSLIATCCLVLGGSLAAGETGRSGERANASSSLDTLAMSVAPDLSQLAASQKLGVKGIAQQAGFSAVFCPIHKRFEAQPTDLSGDRNLQALSWDPLQ